MAEDTAWRRIEDVVSSAAGGTAAARGLHDAAALQLDAAAYALSRIVSELSEVVVLPKPARVAAVHKLERPAQVAERHKRAMAA
jgi:hypothetical protein